MQTVIGYFGTAYDIHVPLLPIMDEHKEDELEYLVNWLDRYIDHAGLKNVILVGSSLGGQTSSEVKTQLTAIRENLPLQYSQPRRLNKTY